MNDEKKGDSFVEREISRSGFLKTTGAVAGVALAGTLYRPGLIFADGPMIFGKKKTYTIAIVPKGLDLPVFAPANLGGQKRAQELGDVDYIFTANSTPDTAANVKAVEGLVSRKVDGIGISVSGPGYDDVINHAVSEGIKVMCWDSDAPTSHRAVFYGVDHEAVGRKMGRAMNRLTGGRGKIVIVSGNAPNLNRRVRGARATLSKGITVLNTLYTNTDIPSAIQATEGAIRAHPDLAGILMAGGWALFANEGTTPLLDKHRGKIKVVSFDPLNATVPYLRDNIVQSVWTQDYWGWGYQSVTILHSLLKGQTWHKFVPQPSHEVTPKDWKLWQERWTVVSSGHPAAAAKVWGEPPLTPPGP